MGESGHSPALVGKHFIMNYYTILHDAPDSLWKFYKDDSVYSFAVEGEPLTPEAVVTGQTAIQDKISSLAFSKCRVHLSIVDAQPTLGGGVLLMVKGSMTSDGPARKFVQTFLLAQQQPSGYYVRNDIFRYLADGEEAKTTTTTASAASEAKTAPKKESAAAAEEKPKQAPAQQPAAEPEQPAVAQPAATPVPEAAQPETKPQAEPVAPTPAPVSPAPAVQEQEQPKETAPAPATSAPVPVAAVTPVTATQPKDAAPASAAGAAPAAKASPTAKSARSTGRGKGKEDKGRPAAAGAAAPAASTATVETAATASPAAPAAAAKPEAPVDNSWAAMAARKKDVPVTPLAPQPRPAAKPVVKKAAEEGTTAATTTPATTDAAAQQTEQADEKPISDPRSVYVSNLPFAAKRNQVVEAFKGFGKITGVTMQYDKGYAFIEYEAPESAQSAIKLASESPISMDGRVLRVEERKTKRGGLLRKGPGAGRGGDKGPRGPRPEGKERGTGSPRPNGTDRRDKNRGDKRAAGSPAPSRPAGAQSAGAGAPQKRAPAASPATAPVAGGATAGKK